jgi:hypothetical protein
MRIRHPLVGLGGILIAVGALACVVAVAVSILDAQDMARRASGVTVGAGLATVFVGALVNASTSPSRRRWPHGSSATPG